MRFSLFLVALVALVALVLAEDAARANFYRCRYDGRDWLVNHIPAGKKRHCRLVMKTPQAASAEGEEGSAPAARTGRKSPRPPSGLRPATGLATGGSQDFPGESTMRLVLEASQRYHLPPAFILAVMKVESNFYPRAVSRVGAQGLMQLMPKTAAGLGVTDAFNPRQNVMGGSRYLRMLATRFDGDMVRTLAGYHAGSGAVDRKEGVPWAATDRYVRMVLDRYYQYKTRLAETGYED